MLFIAAGLLSLVAAPDAVPAKTPGTVHCYKDICHRVRTIEETQAAVGSLEWVNASYYGAPSEDRYNPRSETSSGEMFDPDKPDNVASPVWPDGTILLLWNPPTQLAAIVRVNTAGPYWPDRMLDASQALAEQLGFHNAGVASLLTTVLAAPTPEEASYRRNRSYPPVAGTIGKFATVNEALERATKVLQIAVTLKSDPPPRSEIIGGAFSSTLRKPAVVARVVNGERSASAIKARPTNASHAYRSREVGEQEPLFPRLLLTN